MDRRPGPGDGSLDRPVGLLTMRFHRPRTLSTRPTVSVVIPCYNYGHFLEQAVRSALAQQRVEVDVLIVDDASPDGSAAVARRIAAADPRVAVLVHETNKGHIRTYNDGLEKASGDYVVLLSADDLLSRDALTRAISLMEHHPRVGFVYGYARSFDGAPPSEPGRQRSWTIWPGHQWLEVSARRGRNFISSPEVVMRREAFRDSQGYDARLPHSGDLDMWLRTAVAWDVGRVNGPVQAWYRVHDANMHLTTYSGWITDLEARRKTFDLLFEERAPEVPEVRRIRPMVRRALAREAVRRALDADLEGLGTDVVADYLSFARGIWPGIVATPAWRLCQAGPVAGRRLPVPAVSRLASRARRHLEWRRERRYGT